MSKLIFGKKQGMSEKAATATKRGYDTGRPSTGSKGPTDWKAKPDVGKKKLGLVLKKKM